MIARSKQELKEILKRLEAIGRKKGIYINEEKTKYMEWTKREYTQGQYLTINTETKIYKFEEVERFQYLGATFTRRPNIKEEIQARIMAGNRCIFALNNLLRNKNISRGAKIRIYKTVIRPIVLYASETWTMNKSEQVMLKVWERKVLRKIFGGKIWNGMWIRRPNVELEWMYGEPNIVGVIKSQD
uniref:Uncharacterized protein LOC114342751 n=1 Tax=Diabrotica virgifera virgifera TaxID=50390 RepID=A0A6P7GHM6_DIAVI